MSIYEEVLDGILIVFWDESKIYESSWLTSGLSHLFSKAT